MIYRVREVLNYGGFFAGETVTVTAHAVTSPDEEFTLTIDQGALTNIADRYQIVAGMALNIQLEGDHVVSAGLIGAPERAVLRATARAAAGQPANPGAANAHTTPDGAPRIFSHYCAKCNLWILGAPRDDTCGVEGHAL